MAKEVKSKQDLDELKDNIVTLADGSTKYQHQPMFVKDEEVEEVLIDKKMINKLIQEAKEEVLKEEAKRVLEKHNLDEMINVTSTIEGFEVIDED